MSISATWETGILHDNAGARPFGRRIRSGGEIFFYFDFLIIILKINLSKYFFRSGSFESRRVTYEVVWRDLRGWRVPGSSHWPGSCHIVSVAPVRSA
jgi:hypothetical protein